MCLLMVNHLRCSCVKPSRARWRWKAWRFVRRWPVSETVAPVAPAAKAKPLNSTNCGTITAAEVFPENSSPTPPTRTTSHSDPWPRAQTASRIQKSSSSLSGLPTLTHFPFRKIRDCLDFLFFWISAFFVRLYVCLLLKETDHFISYVAYRSLFHFLRNVMHRICLNASSVVFRAYILGSL